MVVDHTTTSPETDDPLMICLMRKDAAGLPKEIAAQGAEDPRDAARVAAILVLTVEELQLGDVIHVTRT